MHGTTLYRSSPWLAAMLALSACALAPTAERRPESTIAPSPAGFVIGTVAYDFIDTRSAGREPHLLVTFERIAPAPDVTLRYALPATLDAARRSGVFAGALPPGIYAFREAQGGRLHFTASELRMPFEVSPGQVVDAGHYALRAQPPPVRVSAER